MGDQEKLLTALSNACRERSKGLDLAEGCEGPAQDRILQRKSILLDFMCVFDVAAKELREAEEK